MAFFLSDDLTQQDKIDELEKIRLVLKEHGADAAECDVKAKIASEVERIIAHFSAGWVSCSLIAPIWFLNDFFWKNFLKIFKKKFQKFCF